MRMFISGFSPAKELGTRANQKISGYNRIRVDGWKQFEYAACGCGNFRIRIRVDMALVCFHFAAVIYYYCWLKVLKALSNAFLEIYKASFASCALDLRVINVAQPEKIRDQAKMNLTGYHFPETLRKLFRALYTSLVLKNNLCHVIREALVTLINYLKTA